MRFEMALGESCDALVRTTDTGDILGHVRGQNVHVHKNPLQALGDLILGPAGTVVELGLQKPGSGQVKRVKLRRAERYGPSVRSKVQVATSPGGLVEMPEAGREVALTRPRVKLRTVFSKGKSEHNRQVGDAGEDLTAAAAALRACNRGVAQYGAPWGPRAEADAITSTGSVGSDKVEISGVGVALKMGADEMLYVHDILGGGPAERNGCLSHGDRVVAINEVSIDGKGEDECARMMNGAMGTSVTMDLVSVGDFDASEPQVKRISLRRTWLPDVVWNVAGDESWPGRWVSGISDQRLATTEH